MLFTRDYIKEIIINVISVHAEITRLSPRDSLEIKTVTLKLVEAITEEINRIFSQMGEFVKKQKCKKATRICKLWHSRLWSFQGRDTKLERF